MEHPGKSQTLGEALRRRRSELGWSQETPADRLDDLGGDLRQSDVSRLERGKVGLPRRDRLERIAAALGRSLGGLLARSEWAGADGAFERTVDSSPRRESRRPLSLPPPAPTAVPPPPPAFRPALSSPRLRTAIDHAHGLEAWSADVLSRAATTFERANRPTARPVAAAPSSATDDEEHRPPRGR